jgi:hypothetical protein
MVVAMCTPRTLSNFAAGALITIAGCGTQSAPAVHGKVTLDGEPVTSGSIVFLSAASSGPKAAAAIEQGGYAVSAQDKLQPGRYRVEISWRKPTGRKIASADPGVMVDETREAVPPKYNIDSALSAEIGSRDVEKDFALSSK